jgi:hypothetical protein
MSSMDSWERKVRRSGKGFGWLRKQGKGVSVRVSTALHYGHTLRILRGGGVRVNTTDKRKY